MLAFSVGRPSVFLALIGRESVHALRSYWGKLLCKTESQKSTAPYSVVDFLAFSIRLASRESVCLPGVDQARIGPCVDELLGKIAL